jgi:hypothetical protein|tara:strand:- start:759 stop:920 length:162 start_codon:yes stop_codon:yes gene_type:complete
MKDPYKKYDIKDRVIKDVILQLKFPKQDRIFRTETKEYIKELYGLTMRDLDLI